MFKNILGILLLKIILYSIVIICIIESVAETVNPFLIVLELEFLYFTELTISPPNVTTSAVNIRE